MPKAMALKTESLVASILLGRFLKSGEGNSVWSHKTAAGGVQCFLLKSDKLFTLNPTMFQN